MKTSTLLATTIFAASLAACSTTPLPTDEVVGSAPVKMANGIEVGTANLVASGESLSVTFSARGLPSGQKGFHLHTTGSCQPDFSAAGGHLNPANNSHGIYSENGAHLGDLPNLTVAQDGTASASVDLPGSRSMVMNQIFDADGTAVVIHAGPDDYMTDPAGDAGARIACGVLTRN